MPSSFGWTDEMCNGSTIAKYLAERIPAPAFDAIQVRMDLSATAMVHESELEKLIKSSGKDSMFIKVHDENNSALPLELLWLGDDVSLEAALVAAQDPTAYGVAVKNHKVKPRFAIRFKSTDDLKNFAAANSIDDLSIYGRWRLNGLPHNCGATDVMKLLEGKGWEIFEVLYVGEHHAVFIATKQGPTSPLHYDYLKEHKQVLRFKALNQVAKDHQRAAAASARGSEQTPLGKRASQSERQKWTRQAMTKNETNPQTTKRPAATKTGSTPDSKAKKPAED